MEPLVTASETNYTIEQNLKTLQKLKFNILQSHQNQISRNCLQMFVLDNKVLYAC